ncbi:MAG TPA: tetratricopeptide repeat protein [Bryobacteraceae bacterium]|nr:tetratricopeptide repeat protein [Bryobacteraceae bacterium]
MKRNVAALLAVAASAFLATGCNKLKARDNLNRGVQAYKNTQYTQAVERFEEAVKLDPSFPTARLYLAMAYYMQYIPGADSPENQQMADHAMDQFQKVLAQEPKNDVAMKSIASLFYNEKKWSDAESWYKKEIDLNPKDKEAYYTLGVIAWSRWYPVYGAARAKLGMKPEDPGPIKDKKVKEELKTQYLPVITEGIQNLQKALDIDKEYDDAMAYMNLLIREKADLDDTPEEYKKDVETADNWVQKTLETKKIKAERKPISTGINAQ